MGRKVVTVFQDSSVRKAVKAMDAGNFGSVVVLDSLGPCGVFTERDLLTKILAGGRSPDSTILSEVLSPSFPSIDDSASLEAAAVEMVKRKSRLMAFEGAELVGIVTSSDMVRAIAGLGRDFSLQHVISKRLLTALPQTPVDVVVRVMNEKKVGSVLVTEDGKPMGIFTERDLLKRVIAPGADLRTAVENVMSAPLVSRKFGIGGAEAAGVMASNNIKRLPLLSGELTAGMVTARDVVEAFATSPSKPKARVDWMQWN